MLEMLTLISASTVIELSLTYGLCQIWPLPNSNLAETLARYDLLIKSFSSVDVSLSR